MKFDCFRPEYGVWAPWKRWFAWHPVTVAKGDCRWLEYVDRRYKLLWVGGEEYREFAYRPIKRYYEV